MFERAPQKGGDILGLLPKWLQPLDWTRQRSGASSEPPMQAARAWTLGPSSGTWVRNGEAVTQTGAWRILGIEDGGFTCCTTMLAASIDLLNFKFYLQLPCQGHNR